MSHPLDWKLVKSTPLLESRWITVCADSCKLPSGKTIEPFYIIKYPPWLNIVAITDENEVILTLLYRHGIKKTILELPSGTIESTDATAIDAAKRELLEETGYGTGNFIEVGKLSPNPAHNTNFVHCIVATSVKKIAEPQQDDTECIEVIKKNIDEVIYLALNNQLVQSMHVATVFMACQYLQKFTWK